MKPGNAVIMPRPNYREEEIPFTEEKDSNDVLRERLKQSALKRLTDHLILAIGECAIIKSTGCTDLDDLKNELIHALVNLR